MATEAQAQNTNFSTGYVGFDRLLNVPVVASGFNAASSVYATLKGFNSVSNLVIGTAEKVALTVAKPIASAAERPLTVVDSYVASGLDQAEKRVPSLLTSTPSDIVNSASSRFESLREVMFGNLVVFWNFFVLITVHFLNTPPGKLVYSYLENFLGLFENLVERYLPPANDEDALDEDERRTQNVLERFRALFTRIRKRVYRQALDKLTYIHKTFL